MSRPLRIEFPSAWYHVMSRGAGRKNIFRKPEHRKQFRDLLGQVSPLFQCEVHAYCLMSNHYHLLIHTPLGNLGRAMRHLNGVYTQRFNRSVGIDGPLFRGRYKAILVDADSYLLQVSRYIHRNPMEAGQDLWMADPDYSSYPFYAGRAKGCGWLETSYLLKMIGSRNSRSFYRKYVETIEDDEVTRFYSKKRLSPVLGKEDFLESIERYIKDGELNPEISDVRAIHDAPSIKEIQGVCVVHFGMVMKDLVRSRHRIPNVPRDMAIYLCRKVSRCTLSEIASHFGKMSYSGVSKAIARMELTLKSDKKIAGHLKKLTKTMRT
jgi:putative transposase